MFKGARRLPSLWRAGIARRALLALALAASPGIAAESCVESQSGDIARACFENVTGGAPYGHGILGQTPEWQTLIIYPRSGPGADRAPVYLEPRHIFEDIAPRLVDLDGDGRTEIVVVQSSFDKGARLAVFGLTRNNRIKLIASTHYIGRPFRWLAPLGVADLDGDGAMELAYIDRPHLARTLRVWRYSDAKLTEIATRTGLTNHRIGEDFISGGIRDCGEGPEIITADTGWRRVIATRLQDDKLFSRDIGEITGRHSIKSAMGCN